MTDPLNVSTLELATVPSAVGLARRHTNHVLRQWLVAAETQETAELSVSELATNAVKAAIGPAEKLDELPYEEFCALMRRFELKLHRQEKGILIEVRDSDPRPPKLQAQDLEQESGRGLFLVACLSQNWGYYFPSSGGKVVWAEIADPGE